MEDTCTMIRENIHTPESKKIFTVSFLFSLASWLFYGISFMIIAMGTGYVINAFDSIMAVMGANAIGNLPITIGGSGLAEFGIVAISIILIHLTLASLRELLHGMQLLAGELQLTMFQLWLHGYF